MYAIYLSVYITSIELSTYLFKFLLIHFVFIYNLHRYIHHLPIICHLLRIYHLLFMYHISILYMSITYLSIINLSISIYVSTICCLTLHLSIIIILSIYLSINLISFIMYLYLYLSSIIYHISSSTYLSSYASIIFRPSVCLSSTYPQLSTCLPFFTLSLKWAYLPQSSSSWEEQMCVSLPPF